MQHACLAIRVHRHRRETGGGESVYSVAALDAHRIDPADLATASRGRCGVEVRTARTRSSCRVLPSAGHPPQSPARCRGRRTSGSGCPSPGTSRAGPSISSTLSFVTTILSCSEAKASRVGVISLQRPHRCAQKSRSTRLSFLRTVCSKLLSVTVTILDVRVSLTFWWAVSTTGPSTPYRCRTGLQHISGTRRDGRICAVCCSPAWAERTGRGGSAPSCSPTTTATPGRSPGGAGRPRRPRKPGQGRRPAAEVPRQARRTVRRLAQAGTESAATSRRAAREVDGCFVGTLRCGASTAVKGVLNSCGTCDLLCLARRSSASDCVLHRRRSGMAAPAVVSDPQHTVAAAQGPQHLRVKVLRTLPHDPAAFTEGLEIARGTCATERSTTATATSLATADPAALRTSS